MYCLQELGIKIKVYVQVIFVFLSHWTSIGNKNTKTIAEVLFKTYIYISTYWYYYTKKALLFDFVLLN